MQIGQGCESFTGTRNRRDVFVPWIKIGLMLCTLSNTSSQGIGSLNRHVNSCN